MVCALVCATSGQLNKLWSIVLFVSLYNLLFVFLKFTICLKTSFGKNQLTSLIWCNPLSESTIWVTKFVHFSLFNGILFGERVTEYSRHLLHKLCSAKDALFLISNECTGIVSRCFCSIFPNAGFLTPKFEIPYWKNRHLDRWSNEVKFREILLAIKKNSPLAALGIFYQETSDAM